MHAGASVHPHSPHQHPHAYPHSHSHSHSHSHTPIPLPPSAAAAAPTKSRRLSPVALVSSPHLLIPPASVAVAATTAASGHVRPCDYVLYSPLPAVDTSCSDGADFALLENHGASAASGDAAIKLPLHIVIGTAPPLRPTPAPPRHQQQSAQQNRPRAAGRPRLGCLIELDRPSLASLTLAAEDHSQIATTMI
ncbi:hypothetical protein HDU82_002469 [Entophlyctis luteolus]|nr:hypothetical protein HDU82_002469 [Entophlyctis luteolus]